MVQKSEQSIIDKIFNLENFQIAFEKVKNNLIGSIFEGDIEFTNFEKNRDFNLLILIEKALNRNYQRYPYYKYEQKKSSDEIRTIYELHYTDQIIIQSILNILGPELDGKIYDKSYGNRLDLKSKQHIFKDWRKQYTKCYTDLYNEVIKYIDDSRYFLINTDIKDFYNCILIDEIIRILKEFNISKPDVITLIKNFFYQSESSLLILPQGPAFSHLLANLYLSKLDDFVIKSSIDYYRYVDDIWIIFKVDNISEMEGIEEIKEFLHKLNSFLEKYNLKIHDYSENNEGKTKIYNIKKVYEELIENLIVKTYGTFIDFEGSEDFNKETLEFSDFLFLLEEESDKMNIDEFLHKNSFRILAFMKDRYERQKQEIIIHELLTIPKINLKKAIILFSILLEIRNFDITHETYEYLLESPDFILIAFLLALKEKVIESINDNNNQIFKLLKNLIEHPNSNLISELAFKKYISILMNKYFLEFFNRNIPEIIKLTKNSIKLKKIVLLFTNKIENLFEYDEFVKFFQMCSNFNLKELEIRDIILMEDFLYILSLHKDCLKIYQKSKEFFSFGLILFNSDFISSNPQIFTFLIIIFLRISEETYIRTISKLYQNNSKLIDFNINIIRRSKIILSEIYQAKNFEFFKSEKKRYIQYIKDLDNLELQDIIFLNMKEYFFIESPEAKDTIKDIIPFVYQFRDIYYYNSKTDEIVFTEVISSNTVFYYDILKLETCYKKLFSNILKIETEDDKYILKYTIHKDFQPLRDLVELENKDLSDKQFIRILINLVEKLALLDDQDILAFLNFDNIYFNPDNLEVVLIFIGPNLFRKLYYFSFEKEKVYSIDSHREKKIYRMIRNIIFEYFSGISIISNPSLIYGDFFNIINEKIYNPYLNYLFKRSSYEQDYFLFNNFKDYVYIIKRLDTLWDFYKKNQDYCDILEIFDFNLFLIERFFHIIKDENVSNFNKIYRIFNYYHKNLLNISILRNFIYVNNFNWPRIGEIKDRTFQDFFEIINYVNHSKKLDSYIRGGEEFKINSLRFRKLCYFSIFYSYIELIYRVLYFICLKDNLIEQVLTQNKLEKIDENNDRKHHNFRLSSMNIDFDQIRVIIEKLDINRSEIRNIMKEVPLNIFIYLMIGLIIQKKSKKEDFINKIKLNSKTILSRLIHSKRLINYSILQKLIKKYNQIISYPLNKKDISILNIINFWKSKGNLLNHSFSYQFNQILNDKDNIPILIKSIQNLKELFSPLFKMVKRKKLVFIKVRKLGKAYISKKQIFWNENFYDSDLPLITLLPKQLIKDEIHYKYVIREKFKVISILYNYPISRICFNNKKKQSKMLLWHTFISDFNNKLRHYEFGDKLSLDSLMNEFNLPDIKQTEFIIKQCIKQKKPVKKIEFLFDNELIVKEKRRHKIWRSIKKFIKQVICIAIISGIIVGLILNYLLG